MAYHGPKTCPVCAWRATCVKRATSGGDGLLNCPEFTEDVVLRKEREREEVPGEQGSKENT